MVPVTVWYGSKQCVMVPVTVWYGSKQCVMVPVTVGMVLSNV